MITETITLESTRFGTLEIPHEAVVEFPNGLIGLGGRRYALLARDAFRPALAKSSAQNYDIWDRFLRA